MDKIIHFIISKIKYIYKHMRVHSIQVTISISFTIVSVCSMCFLGITLYEHFVKRAEDLTIESSEQLLNQTAINLEDYMRNMRRISDTMYYSVIKDTNLATNNLDKEMNLLYEANKDKLISIACYTSQGELVAATPNATEKLNINVVNQWWFLNAVEQMENLHFSTPHVQNLFDDTSFRYYWVVSLSRAVELTTSGNSMLGVLLVDMNYSSIEQILEKANTDNNLEYVYLVDRNGEIIYHPKQQVITSGIYKENNMDAVKYEDGSCEEILDGSKRLITVKTISYTGWKIINVVPMSSFNMGLYGTRYFMIMLIMLSLLAVVILNQLVSAQIAKPLQRLNNSVKEWEAGNLKPSIYVGGSLEVEHLGRTLRSTVEQIHQLMNDILTEQEEKRKSELDVLQSQINPHFLYNTLDSIVWMIEGERYDDAVFMVTQLASLFRISLSRGKMIICLDDEIKHAKNYMNIQKIRYKNVFTFDFSIDSDILQCCTVKLVLQPLLENAIYYGVEYMDGEGEIHVRGYRRENNVYIEVCDNGLGIPPENLKHLLEPDNKMRKHGSGVGLINVHNRIQLCFGQRYGLEIDSWPDEGTTVRIHIPFILYSVETEKQLESGKKLNGKEGSHEKE